MEKDMRLVEYFLFTQNSLATFDKCPLKFHKRYMENLKWDSYPEESIKRTIEMGTDFHLLANRYFLGCETGLEEYSESFADLKTWVDNLKEYFKIEESQYRYLPEFKLRLNKPPLKLEANYDLIIEKDGFLEIWDWKTHREKPGINRKFAINYKNSLQTKVYMFVLKELSHHVMGEEVPTSRIKMYYWQPEPPKVVEEIIYTDEMHEEFRKFLEDKINHILNYNFDDFNKAQYEKHCRLCEFNWFCNNENVDFNAIFEEEFSMEEFDFDDIDEKF